MVLTPQEREKFETDGYLVIDPEISLEVMDGVLADVADMYPEKKVLNGELRPVGRVQDAWKESANAKAIATAPKVLEILREIYGRKPLPFQTLNFPIGTQQRTHSDTVHFSSIPEQLMCGVWLALEDIDMDNGPLIYYPGSHKLPFISMDDVDEAGFIKLSFIETLDRSARQVWHLARQIKNLQPLKPRHNHTFKDNYKYYEDYIQHTIDQVKAEPSYGLMKKGQALIWAANLLHGGSPQKDMGRSRHSQVTHYYFEGCKYYTPLYSKGEDKLWRYPVCIE